MRHLTIIYDGQCPFCTRYVELVRLREVFKVSLVDARTNRDVTAAYDVDPNDGLIVDLDGEVHHGAAAMSLLSALSRYPGPMSWPLVAKALYPAMRFGRTVTLRVLGRQAI